MQIQKTKPVVYYDPSRSVLDFKVGYSALVFPLNHPNTGMVSNTKLIHTSLIISVGENGVFETRNTIYKPKG
jgi:hypothetical protein